MLAREIIKSIDAKFLEKYDQLIQSGELDFNYEIQEDDNLYVSVFKYSKQLNKGIINVNREFNYTDVTTLVHEFVHYINGVNLNVNNNRYLLTEFFSIYFEQYAINYLLERGILKTELDYTFRFQETKKISNFINWYGLVLIAYEKFDNIDKNTFQSFQSHCSISFEEFEKRCNKVLKDFGESQKQYEIDIRYEKNFEEKNLSKYLIKNLKKTYRYLLGTL